MHSKIYWIETFANAARLGIMARPRGHEWLEDEIVSLKKQNVNYLISLLESAEIKELGLNQEESICSEQGINFFNFPIADRNLPGNDGKADAFIDMLFSKIQTGSSVVVHCRMGIGRASIIAGGILLKTENYNNVDHLITKISLARGLKVPDTDEQKLWLGKRLKKR